MINDRRIKTAESVGSSLPPSIPEPQSSHVLRVTQHTTLERVLDLLRDGPPGNVTLLLDPLSVLFATPDHFRALDAVRLACRLSVTIEVADAHRTGLALAFGYRVRPPGNHPEDRTAPVPDIQYGPPNRTGVILAPPLVAAQPSAVAVRPQHIAQPANGARRFSRRGMRIALLSVAIAFCGVIGAGGVVWHVHTADVTVQPLEESFSRVVPFAVSVTPTDDPNALQTKMFETTITREGDAAATGTTTVPDATASGVMTFRSRADGVTTLKSGTALKGPHDVSYVLQSDVAIPGLDFVRGQLGEASGKVRASQPGPAGNLAGGFSARYTDNVTYISGDITGGTEKQVAVVSDNDIASTRARLESELRMHALTEVNAALPPGVTALNDYLALPQPNVTALPPAGTQADTVHIRLAITARVPIYQNADFDALIDRRLTEAVRDTNLAADGEKQVLPETVAKSKPVFIDVQGPLVRYSATVTGKTRAILSDTDLARMRAALVGRDAHSAEQILSNERAVGGYAIHYSPSWMPTPLRDRMPRTPSHISLHDGATR